MFTAHPIGIIIILIIALLVFGGRGKISAIMGDLGKGITSFKKGLKDDAAEAKMAAKSDPADDALDVTPRKKD
ncbi:twin-arginine translocase TatA/TatE family subunit [uncultured Algimonas sp.]|uniref:twin-arginine translocase TatA/TatE family subunit n=1 Tax=uncultured Algimonas sp. TaxID=1547920 RepID=UPI00262551D9|nr:twin-arginine translocase TatA/TatE family subunit [uncultured Algimonas sp.]